MMPMQVEQNMVTDMVMDKVTDMDIPAIMNIILIALDQPLSGNVSLQ